MSVEHIGKAFLPQKDLSFKVSDTPSFRMFFTTWNSTMLSITKAAILSNDFRRSAIIPQWAIKKVTGKSRGISGEFYNAGFPVVGFLSGPPYLFFLEDTLDTVATDQLAPTANLLISMIREADDLPLKVTADAFNLSAFLALWNAKPILLGSDK